VRTGGEHREVRREEADEWERGRREGSRDVTSFSSVHLFCCGMGGRDRSKQNFFSILWFCSLFFFVV
jgi:hypothetical protein